MNIFHYANYYNLSECRQKICPLSMMHIKVSLALAMHAHNRTNSLGVDKLEEYDGNHNYAYFEKQCGRITL